MDNMTQPSATPPHALDPEFPQQPDIASDARVGRGYVVLGGILAILFAAAVIYGIHSRTTHEDTLKSATEAAAIPTVNTTYPSGGANAQEVILPGNVQAFIETPIYARTNGYLKKWYFDIGAHVRKGQLLATIETPELDQQLEQSPSELERIPLAGPPRQARRLHPGGRPE